MNLVDFGITLANQKDVEFVSIFKNEARKRGYSFLEVNYNNINNIIEAIINRKLCFKSFIDLSSFDHPAFAILLERLHSRADSIINNPECVINNLSKSVLHRLFESNALPIRKSFIVSKKKSNKDYLMKIIKSLKTPFVLSPVFTSEENGIVLNARSARDIDDFLKRYPIEECLAQEYIIPSVISGKVAWFRIIYVCGRVLPHWWDPGNHFYQRFGKDDDGEHRIGVMLAKYTRRIAELTGLELFSTEIVISHDGKYVIIDYANYPIDLGSQEKERDSVPVGSLRLIARAIVDGVGRKIS